jgi:hypothetical protein
MNQEQLTSIQHELEGSVYSFFMDTILEKYEEFCEEEGIDSSKYSINLTDSFIQVTQG